MNYRHAFHAGNFADLLKHAVLTHILDGLAVSPAPCTVIDTHAGAGLYDLRDVLARRTDEASDGVHRLMSDPHAPSALAALKVAVRAANASDEVRYYPGSPMLVARALKTGDRAIACELRPDDHSSLAKVVGSRPGFEVLNLDGWSHAVRAAPASPARLLVLVDPPFERGDDYQNIVKLTGAVLDRNPDACLAIWTPLKDLATFDAFCCDLEDVTGAIPVLAIEARLGRLTNPLRMNGCAMIVVNPPAGLASAGQEAAEWVASRLGGEGASARIGRFGQAG